MTQSNDNIKGTDLQDSKGDKMNNKSNQVSEIEEQIEDILETFHCDTCNLAPGEAMNYGKAAIKSLLSLSNKRAELEGRIDELEKLPIRQIIEKDGTKRDVVYFHDVITAIGINKTISELNQLKEDTK